KTLFKFSSGLPDVYMSMFKTKIEEFLGVLFRSYAEPQLRASQLQLDKNAEPPWDPDPYRC
ncbi:hypothetical protein TELCIR_05978, partial [Teladorsagia circumcincta]